MRRHVTAICAAVVAAISAPALAQTSPPAAVTVSGGATLVSDYRFRGLSQSNLKPAIQGTFTISHASGFYVTVWGSSIDKYVANNGQEIDLIGGFKKALGGTTVDVGVLYYWYPNAGSANTDFAEPYASVSHTLGPVTAKVSAAYAWNQRGLSLNGVSRENNFYMAGDLTAGIPRTPVTVAAHVGHSFEPSYITFGKKYTDWSVGANYVYKNLTVGISYVDTDTEVYNGNRNLSRGGVVGVIGASF